MKSSVVKMILPVGAFILASAGAISTNVSNTSKEGIETMGWARLTPEQPCTQVRTCDNNSLITCKQSGVQVYDISPVDNCSTVLFHSGI